jgi:hypothetical protein
MADGPFNSVLPAKLPCFVPRDNPDQPDQLD